MDAGAEAGAEEIHRSRSTLVAEEVAALKAPEHAMPPATPNGADANGAGNANK